ncbi:allantoate amidohydrolase [Adhaeribacter aquaticus]|uniref:allantoate amidohydrolase n=1 Tax=Adhaeribacter aquaticus TaxID=299567 RepID=UPI0003F82A6F|nr:allantoate amidohydrolase [Adhaeribacter aquaticus]
MRQYLKRAEKLLKQINELATISEQSGAITRTYGSEAFIKASQQIKNWMEAAGLDTYIDNIGNVRGKLTCSNPEAKTFVIGSHLDSVANAGKFDGPLGIVMGLEMVSQIDKNKLPFNIELIAFCDEEGVRFHSTYLGSKVVAGSFDKNNLKTKDASGISLQEVIISMGGNPDKLCEDAIKPDDWLGYFEIHIEQGPVLYERNIPVALVTAIAGQNRIEVMFKGVAGHAGTVPMDMRQDALCCAAEFIISVEKYANKHKKEIVATVGKLHIPNSASNVIPGLVTCTLDLRSADEAMLFSANIAIKNMCRDICQKRNVLMDWHQVQNTNPVTCDVSLNNLLNASIERAGYTVIQLVSGAGHDAVPISKISPATMLFVRCFKGISHNPLEDVELKDIAASIHVADIFLQQLIQQQK